MFHQSVIICIAHSLFCLKWLQLALELTEEADLQNHQLQVLLSFLPSHNGLWSPRMLLRNDLHM